jgi:hypothetical protein
MFSSPAQQKTSCIVLQREAVVAGRHGRVGGKDALPLDRLHIVVVEQVALKPPRPFIEQLQSEQRRVPFVHVEAVHLMIAERAQHPHPADA